MRIFVTYRSLDEMASAIEKEKRELHELAQSIQKEIYHLDWQIKSKQDILNQSSKITKQIETISDDLTAFSSFLAEAMEAYKKLDEYKEVDISSPLDEEEKSSEKNPGFIDWLAGLISDIFDFLDDVTTIPGLAFIGGIISYIQSLIHFGQNPGSFAEYFDLFDESGSLFHDAHSLLSLVFKDNPNKTGLFTPQASRYVGALYMLTSLGGIFSEGSEDWQEIVNNPDLSFWGKAGALTDTGLETYDFITGAVSMGGGGDPKSTVAMTFYSAIGKSVVGFFGQGMSSYDKYSADGDFTMYDLGKVGEEASIRGLYELIDKASFGLLDKENTGIGPDEIVEFFDGVAEYLGTGLGKAYLFFKEKLGG